jgi:hypothetical protein
VRSTHGFRCLYTVVGLAGESLDFALIATGPLSRAFVIASQLVSVILSLSVGSPLGVYF